MMAVVLLLAVCLAAYISCFKSFFVQFDFCLFSVVDPSAVTAKVSILSLTIHLSYYKIINASILTDMAD